MFCFNDDERHTSYLYAISLLFTFRRISDFTWAIYFSSPPLSITIPFHYISSVLHMDYTQRHQAAMDAVRKDFDVNEDKS